MVRRGERVLRLEDGVGAEGGEKCRVVGWSVRRVKGWLVQRFSLWRGGLRLSWMIGLAEGPVVMRVDAFLEERGRRRSGGEGGGSGGGGKIP